MNRLRPCPFCGSDDVEIVRQSLEEDEAYHYSAIYCNHCGATVQFAECECTRVSGSHEMSQNVAKCRKMSQNVAKCRTKL